MRRGCRKGEDARPVPVSPCRKVAEKALLKLRRGCAPFRLGTDLYCRADEARPHSEKDYPHRDGDEYLRKGLGFLGPADRV